MSAVMDALDAELAELNAEYDKEFGNWRERAQKDTDEINALQEAVANQELPFRKYLAGDGLDDYLNDESDNEVEDDEIFAGLNTDLDEILSNVEIDSDNETAGESSSASSSDSSSLKIDFNLGYSPLKKTEHSETASSDDSSYKKLERIKAKLVKEIDETKKRYTQIGQPKNFVEPRKEEILEDQYFPGILDDVINKKADYYHIVPDEEVIDVDNEDNDVSLIEAFDMRCEFEQENTKQNLSLNTKIELDPQDLKDVASGPSPQKPIREEVMLAAVTAIDIDNMIHDKLDTDLTSAINSLTKAEVMVEQLRSIDVHRSNVLTQSSRDHHEQGSEFVMKNEIPKISTLAGTGSYHPLEIISYIGMTGPTRK